MMRRNDIVLVGKPDMFNFYGRVNRIVDSGHAEVICCGKHIQILPFDELKVENSYKGCKDFDSRGRFRRMPTLRKLKQMASYYDKTVWKRNRNTPPLSPQSGEPV